MLGPPILLLLPFLAYVPYVMGDREYDRICPTGDGLVTLPSGNKIRYLCDDCLIDPAAQSRFAETIEQCADFCNTEDCKATMWSSGNCFLSKLTYTGPSTGSTKGCIWMTSQTCFDSKDDCTTCLHDKEECERQKRKCEDALAICKPGDDECEKKARKCRNDLNTCEDEKNEAKKKERKCQDALASCKPGDDECEKKARKCRNDLDTCEDERSKVEKKERRCQSDLLDCQDGRTEAERKERKCQGDLNDSRSKAGDLQQSVDQCADALDKCKKSESSWGTTEGEIKCKSGSLTTATLNGNKWLTLCGFIINDVKGGVQGLNLKQCVESCSQDDKCRAITYDDHGGVCYLARKFKTGDMRYSNYYHTVLRLT
ncbi:hypothetical protein BDV26DRAFT_300053 [Aspergillus bertholletiae]|uniref:Apple domain-containing protein n=1 Tax=Aspergillus bertholletiae TaxID=1226010 RepID=A0A5N7B0R7_9EURO|nr:hypothetical protein BDV26DRAFT_300053 [Aspergillus bertholletiae]